MLTEPAKSSSSVLLFFPASSNKDLMKILGMAFNYPYFLIKNLSI